MPLEQAISDNTLANQELATTVTNKLSEYESRIAAKEAEVDNFLLDAMGTSPSFNLLSDSGKFAGATSPYAQTIPTSFIAPYYLSPYNGTSAGIEAGKFIHNNSTNGGTAGALTPTTSDLLTVMGRSGAKALYGNEFFIAEYTMGTGTSLSNIDGAHLMFNRAKSVMGAGNNLSLAIWLRSVDTSIYVLNSYVDGVFYAQKEIAQGDGWVYVVMIFENVLGYISSFPYIYANANNRVQFAMPALTAGKTTFGRYTSPIPAYDINQPL